MGTVISESKHFVFVHIPKTAGLSLSSQLDPFRRNAALDRKPLRAALNLARIYTGQPAERLFRGRVVPEHAGLSDLLALDPQLDLVQFHKFAVVRNPWDRIASFYAHHKSVSRSRYLRPDYWRTRHLDFAEWLQKVHAPRRRAGLLKSQAEMLRLPGSDSIALDRLLRFETLAQDFAALAHHLDLPATALPRLNASRRSDPRALYSESLRDLIGALYADDIATFGYRFDD